MSLVPYAPPPLGRSPRLPREKAAPRRRPARVPLWAAGATTAVFVLAVLFGPVSGRWFFGIVAVLYGLPIVATLLVVAGLAKLADSRAVGIGGTLFVAGPGVALLWAAYS